MASLINPVYLKAGNLWKLSSAYRSSEPIGVQVNSFLAGYGKILSSASRPNFKLSESRDQFSFFEDKNSKALDFFKSLEFLSFVSAISGNALTKVDCSLKAFMPGNFTLSHWELNGNVEFAFDMTPNWQDSFGGESNFVTGNGARLRIFPIPNTLILVQREGMQTQSYIKYVNHKAGQNARVLVSGILS